MASAGEEKDEEEAVDPGDGESVDRNEFRPTFIDGIIARDPEAFRVQFEAWTSLPPATPGKEPAEFTGDSLADAPHGLCDLEEPPLPIYPSLDDAGKRIFECQHWPRHRFPKA